MNIEEQYNKPLEAGWDATRPNIIHQWKPEFKKGGEGHEFHSTTYVGSDVPQHNSKHR